MKWLLIGGVALVSMVTVIVVTGLLLPKAHVAMRNARLKHPPERVWAPIAGDQSWRPDIRRYEPLPDRNGRRAWKETDKHGGSITFETMESDQPRRLVTRIADTNLAFGGSWIYEISPEAGGSAVHITERGEVYNPIFRFVSRFIMGHTATIDGYRSALAKHLDEGGQARGTGM